jgi:streptogramin lyase
MSLYDRLKAAQEQDPSVAEKPATAGQKVIDALRHHVAEDQLGAATGRKQRRLPFVLGILGVLVLLIIIAIAIAVFFLGFGRQWFQMEQSTAPAAAGVITMVPDVTPVSAVVVQPTVDPASPTASPQPSPTSVPTVVPTTVPTAVPTMVPTAAPDSQSFTEPKNAITPIVDLILDGEGIPHGLFNHPLDVANDSRGTMYLLDSGNHRVQRIGSDGRFIIYWGRNGAGNGTHDLVEPVAIATDKQDNVLVLDSATGWVKRYNSEGEFLNQWAGPGAELDHPRGMIVDFDGYVWIADTGNARLLRYAPDGRIQSIVGPQQVGTANLLDPVSLALDAQGNLYIADTGSRRIIKLNREYKVITEWSIPAATAALGNHIAVTAKQNLLVTDPESNRLLEYTLDGKLLKAWGQGGKNGAQFAKPVGIEVLGEKVYVVDTFNNRLQVLHEGKMATPE